MVNSWRSLINCRFLLILFCKRNVPNSETESDRYQPLINSIAIIICKGRIAVSYQSNADCLPILCCKRNLPISRIYSDRHRTLLIGIIAIWKREVLGRCKSNAGYFLIPCRKRNFAPIVGTVSGRWLFTIAAPGTIVPAPGTIVPAPGIIVPAPGNRSASCRIIWIQ